MAKKVKKNNQNTIIGMCTALIILAVIIVAIVLIVKNINNSLGDSFFVSDNTKYVLNLENDDYQSESEDYQPQKTHIVYYYSGDNITNAETYYEYNDNATAKKAYDYYKENYDDNFEKIEVKDKYLILTSKKADYEEMTPEDVKQQLEFIESVNNTDSSIDAEDSIEEESIETEENTNTAEENATE